ncbi:MAG: hypothetical protein AAFZ65_10135, partial [Planctomycetota bacterium]
MGSESVAAGRLFSAAAVSALVTSAIWYAVALGGADPVAGAASGGASREPAPPRAEERVRAPVERTDAGSRARIAELEAQLAEARRQLDARADAPAPASIRVSERHSAAAAWLAELLPGTYAGLTAEEAALLRELDLRGATLTDADLAVVAGLTNLRQLILRGTEVRDLGVARLGGLDRLETLSLRGTRVEGATLGALPRGLRHLDLTHCPVGDDDLAGLMTMPGLETVDLMGSGVTDGGMETLGRLGSLRKVELDGTAITDAGLRRLLELNPYLTRVEVRNTAVSDALARA